MSETIRDRKLKFYKHIDGPSAFLDMKIFPLGVSHGGSAPTVNLGPPHISEIIRVRKLKFYTQKDRPSALFENENFFARGVIGMQRPLL